MADSGLKTKTSFFDPNPKSKIRNPKWHMRLPWGRGVEWFGAGEGRMLNRKGLGAQFCLGIFLC
jgi:hypothetical protein